MSRPPPRGFQPHNGGRGPSFTQRGGRLGRGPPGMGHRGGPPHFGAPMNARGWGLGGQGMMRGRQMMGRGAQPPPPPPPPRHHPHQGMNHGMMNGRGKTRPPNAIQLMPQQQARRGVPIPTAPPPPPPQRFFAPPVPPPTPVVAAPIGPPPPPPRPVPPPPQQPLPLQHTPAQLAAAWTEHKAPTGVTYFYNSITKKSVYDRPEALKRPTTAVALVPQTKNSNNGTWKEYTDGSTGRKYYSNGTTTTWEKPAVATATKTTVAEPEKKPKPTEPTSRKKQKTVPTQFSSKAEAIAAFKGLLIAKDVAPTLKWHEVAKLYVADTRWRACEDVLTTGERKQALSEYQTKRANELRQQERQEKQRAREAFHELLNEVAPVRFSSWNTRFADIRDELATDDRFHAVADEATRESLFLDFCEDYRKREDRKKRNIKRDAQDNFVSFLKEKEEEGLLSHASTWTSFLASLSEEAKSDARFASSPALSDSERQLSFADHVIALQAAEDEKQRRIRDARRRAEHAQRDAYRETLRSLAEEGVIFPWSAWRDVETKISAEASYAPLSDQSQDAPRALFEQFVDEWYNRYRHDRILLSRLSSRQPAQDAAFETFSNALMESAAAASNRSILDEVKRMMNRSDPVSSVRVFFRESPQGRTNRRGSVLRRSDDYSSEDEGEIIEDGEIADEVANDSSFDEPAHEVVESGQNSSSVVSYV